MEQEQTFLITGATGMVGGSLARRILKKELPCRIILPVRDLEKAKEMYKGLKMADKEKLDFVEMQLEDIRAERFFMPVDYAPPGRPRWRHARWRPRTVSLWGRNIFWSLPGKSR